MTCWNVFDAEAISRAENLKKKSNQSPVYFSISNTAGEKPVEEFVTGIETVDMDRYLSVWVITGK